MRTDQHGDATLTVGQVARLAGVTVRTLHHYEMHRGLADVYLADERFRKHYDDQRAGLADFGSAAIRALYPSPPNSASSHSA